MQLAGSLLDELHLLSAPGPTNVLWVEGPDSRPVAAARARSTWRRLLAERRLAERHRGAHQRHHPAGARRTPSGSPTERLVDLDVGSPFDYEQQALLYCAAHLPDPRQPGFDEAVHDELAALIDAAGGRTLALFTSFRAMDAAAEALRGRVDHPILDPARAAQAGAARRPSAPTRPPACSPPWASGRASTCPGRTLSLVTIDRLPFPRPDEPLLQARRELAGEAAFRTVDLPRAVTLLAQGVGPADPHRPTTVASSPCSTPAWPPPRATAGTSSGPSPRCAAPATAPRPSSSSKSLRS